MLEKSNFIRLTDFARDGGIPYSTLARWVNEGSLRVLKDRGALYISLAEIKRLIDSRSFKKYLQFRNTPELSDSLNKLYSEYLKEREIFLNTEVYIQERSPYMYCEKLEEPAFRKGCPDCKKEKKKTIVDYTPHPVDCIERRQVKGDVLIVTLMYFDVGEKEQEDIMSFFDQVEED